MELRLLHLVFYLLLYQILSKIFTNTENQSKEHTSSKKRDDRPMLKDLTRVQRLSETA